MFYLKSPANRDGQCLIYAQFNYHGKHLKLSTGLKIAPSDWDKGKRLPKRTFRFYSRYRAILERVEGVILDTYLETRLRAIPGVTELSEAVKAALDPPRLTVAAHAKRLAMTKKGENAKTFGIAAKHIEAFDPAITFDSVTADTLRKFFDWLLARGYSQNSAAHFHMLFKAVMKDAADQGLHSNMRFRGSKVSKVATTQIFLTEPELDAIAAADLPEHLADTRDAFLVSCYTGVRYSDIPKINRDSFVINGLTSFFRVVNQKTKSETQIPAHPTVLRIMDRHGWRLKIVDNAQFNVNLKKIGQAAGIDTPIVVTRYPSGVRVDETMPKWKLITAHTGRRSLICNLYLAGVPVETIKRISGHKSHEAFMRYLRLTPQDHINVAQRSGFFTRS